MLTPFVTALVVGNCMAGLCLVGSVALVCGVTSLNQFPQGGADCGGAVISPF